jgi:circadian clock protein KaiC
MNSVGIDLDQWSKKGLLTHKAWRPTQFGIEMHLLRIHKFIEKVKPQCVVIDPITNLLNGSSDKEVYSMLMRLLDFLKVQGITAVFVSLTSGGDNMEQTTVGISSLTDTWILLRDLELNGERNRCVYVLKSRGMAHSNQLREFVLTGDGIRLLPVYIGPGGVLTGSSRITQESAERAEALQKQQEIERKQLDATRKRLTIQAQVAALQAELEAVEKEEKVLTQEDREREMQDETDRATLAKSRGSRDLQPR